MAAKIAQAIMCRILNRFRPKRMYDPVFGELRFSDGGWDGEGLFVPLNISIAYTVEAGESGPSAAQHELYRRIGERYRECFQLIAPVLQGETSVCLSRDAVLSLDWIRVPSVESDDMDWEISYGCDDDPDWAFSVQMKGWRPTGDVTVSH